MQVLFAPFCKIYCEICIWCVLKLHNMHFFTIFAAFCPPRRRFGASLNAASCKYQGRSAHGRPRRGLADTPAGLRRPLRARRAQGNLAPVNPWAFQQKPHGDGSPSSRSPIPRPSSQTASGPFHPERPRSIRRAHCMPIMFMTPAATPMTAATMPSIQKAR